MTAIFGRRVLLRPLSPADFSQWREVRRRNAEWLTKWEPSRPVGAPDVIEDPHAFTVRCNARDRERQMGAGYGFGVFVDGGFAGEINITNIQRGPFQNAYVGYWIDQARAGNSYMSEAVIVLSRFGFEDLRLHRLQIAIVPRNLRSRRVMEKLRVREEGVAVRYLENNGVWEDHMRFALTSEEWAERRAEFQQLWL